MQLTLGYLYPDLMNIYGDQGNVIVLQKRCLWRGINFEIKKISLKEKPEDLKKCDLFFFGGGQDRQQIIVAENLFEKATILLEMLKKGIPMLSICGGYQLLGKSYYFENKTLPGLGFFDAETKAGKTRFINNILVETNITGKKQILIGFENHAGRTYLQKPTLSLGKVIKGHGNNGEDMSEGAIKFNTLGTYLHGPLLPKNPSLADFIIKKALEKKYKKVISLTPLDDKLEWEAHNAAIQLLF